MKLRDSLSHLCIRLALASFFIWTGAGKLFYSNEYSGNAAATLANMGIVEGPGTPSRATPPTEAPTPENQVPASPPDPSTSEPDTQARAGEAAIIAVQASGGAWSAADFDEPVTARRVHTVTLMLKNAANQGRWPGFLSSDQAIKITAFVICGVEFVGGILVLVGFFTRIASLGLVAAAAGSLVFTTILPAMAAGDTFLWILPPHQLSDPDVWVGAWSPWLLRFFAFMGAVALLLGGPGKIAVDALLFPDTPRERGSSSGDGDEDDD
ncbi:MAG: DoxX family protein [Phycisphaerales bacterium]|nr:DoxX family protein [Phycisphaerales bacterium]